MDEMNLKNTTITEKSSDKSFPFFRILYRNLALIVVIIVASLIIGTVYGTVVVKPVYTAKCDAIFKVNILGSGDSYKQGSTSLAKSSLPTCSDFIKSPAVEAAARNASGDRSISRNAVSVSYSTDSLIISISYTASTQEAAERRLGAYMDAAATEFEAKTPVENVSSISLVKLQNVYKITESNDGSNYIFIGFIAGVVLGITVAVLRYLLDNKLKDKDEVEEITGVSLLSYIDKQ